MLPPSRIEALASGGLSETSLTTFLQTAEKELPLVCSPPFIPPTRVLHPPRWPLNPFDANRPQGSIVGTSLRSRPLVEITARYAFNHSSHLAGLFNGKKTVIIIFTKVGLVCICEQKLFRSVTSNLNDSLDIHCPIRFNLI